MIYLNIIFFIFIILNIKAYKEQDKFYTAIFFGINIGILLIMFIVDINGINK